MSDCSDSPAEFPEADEVVREELTGVVHNLVRSAATIANNRIQSHAVKRKEPAPTSAAAIKEEDGVYVGEMGDSVATTIKKEAVKLRPDFYKLTFEGRDITALGLNSILDLTPMKDAAQKRLFGDQAWGKLLDRYRMMLPECGIINKHEEKISQIESYARTDLRDAQAHAQRFEMASTRSDEADLYSIYAHYLEFMQYHSYVFDKDLDITEHDLAIKVWGQILEKLFRQTKLRCKWGDTVGDSSGIAGISGFKVDLRVLKDTVSRVRKEADKANVELARLDAPLSKTAGDRTKLLIESKCVLDRLIKESPHTTEPIIIPALQLSGAKAQLYLLKLVANGLYVGVKEASGTLPNKTSDIKNFRNVIKLLYKFKRATLDVAEVSLYNSDSSDNSDDGDDGGDSDDDRDDNETAASITNTWIRGTWLPPKGVKKQRVPSVPSVLVHTDL